MLILELCPSVQAQTTGKRSHKNKNDAVMQNERVNNKNK
jgi:hypothetical protein